MIIIQFIYLNYHYLQFIVLPFKDNIQKFEYLKKKYFKSISFTYSFNDYSTCHITSTINENSYVQLMLIIYKKKYIEYHSRSSEVKLYIINFVLIVMPL